ncbi:MAG: hypothetical protein EA406_02200 [Rhodospirillales bacterium]|nr:MAG: hypothetical protein EA406_02200 [Rhodospirillales bacterium]
MAFNQKELGLLGYTGSAPNLSNHLYFYANTEEDTVTTAGFFNAATAQMRVGDFIFIGDTGQIVHVSAINATTGAVTVQVTAAPSS